MLKQISNIVIDVAMDIKKIVSERKVSSEWIGSQLKSEVDVVAHEKIFYRLKEISDTIPIISEEDEESIINHKVRPEKYWLIDPIDGTASLIGGFTGYVTQIVLMVSNVPLISAIYAPALDLLFAAEKGKGAFLNGRRLKKLTQKKNYNTIIDNYPEPRGTCKKLYDHFNFKNYIESGSISLKICKIANGDADVFFKDVSVKDWDIAAPHLILNEVHGSITDILGNDIRYTGEFEKNGLITCATKTQCKEIADWYVHLKE